jgi:hypothetical protein
MVNARRQIWLPYALERWQAGGDGNESNMVVFHEGGE